MNRSYDLICRHVRVKDGPAELACSAKKVRPGPSASRCAVRDVLQGPTGTIVEIQVGRMGREDKHGPRRLLITSDEFPADPHGDIYRPAARVTFTMLVHAAPGSRGLTAREVTALTMLSPGDVGGGMSTPRNYGFASRVPSSPKRWLMQPDAPQRVQAWRADKTGRRRIRVLDRLAERPAEMSHLIAARGWSPQGP